MNVLYTMIDTNHQSLESFLTKMKIQKEYVNNRQVNRISTMDVETLLKIRPEGDRYKIIKLHVNDKFDMPLRISDITKAEAIQTP